MLEYTTKFMFNLADSLSYISCYSVNISLCWCLISNLCADGMLDVNEANPAQDVGYVAYYFFCAGSIFVLVQGIALFAAGLTSPKAALSQSAYSLIASAVTLLQYFTIGYSLNTSSSEPNGALSNFVGNFHRTLWRHVFDDDDNPVIALGKAVVSYSLATVAASLVASGPSQRARIIPLILFLVLWLTVVYCPVSFWCWNDNGWAHKLGALDYAGGTAIHCTSGFTALVYSLVLGPRLGYGSAIPMLDQPYSLPFLVLGTAFMWVGWIGFNGGASLEPQLQSLYAVVNTQLAASASGFAWMTLDHTLSGQWSIVSFCSGVVAGLVTVTPSAGFIEFWAALIVGAIGGVTCNLATNIKFRLAVDDPLDIFAVHGIGGIVGSILTGIFAHPDLGGVRSKGLLWGGWLQPFKQALSTVATASYTMAMGLMLLVLIDSLPGLHLRISAEQEALGVDLTEHGETAAFAFSGGDMSRAQNSITPAGVFNVPGSSGGGIPGTDMGGMQRLRLTHLNTSMNPQYAEWPLLQKLPASYGTLSGQAGPSDLLSSPPLAPRND